MPLLMFNVNKSNFHLKSVWCFLGKPLSVVYFIRTFPLENHSLFQFRIKFVLMYRSMENLTVHTNYFVRISVVHVAYYLWYRRILSSQVIYFYSMNFEFIDEYRIHVMFTGIFETTINGYFFAQLIISKHIAAIHSYFSL